MLRKGQIQFFANDSFQVPVRNVNERIDSRRQCGSIDLIRTRNRDRFARAHQVPDFDSFRNKPVQSTVAVEAVQTVISEQNVIAV